MKNFVCVETSSTCASVAYFWNGTFHIEQVSAAPRGHSEFLLVSFQKFMKDNNHSFKDLDGVCITKGPGSFTGIRVATSFAKTLCYSLGLRCWAAESLAPISYASLFDGPRLVVQNAFKNLIYIDRFETRTIHSGTRVVDLENLSTWVRENIPRIQTVVLGDAQDLFKSHLQEDQKLEFLFDSSKTAPQARALGELYLNHPDSGETLDWKTIIPLYIRGSEAEESLRRHHSES